MFFVMLQVMPFDDIGALKSLAGTASGGTLVLVDISRPLILLKAAADSLRTASNMIRASIN